jgi:hypothetical protein
MGRVDDVEAAVTRKVAPRKNVIIAAQSDLIRSLSEKLMDFDPNVCCWACGDDSMETERAHVVPRSGGGSFEPSNFWLLCGLCHREHPDCASPEAQLEWLISHESRINVLLADALNVISRVSAMPRCDSIVETMKGKYFGAGRGTREVMLNVARFELLADYKRWSEG